MKLYDISAPLSPSLPFYPGDPKMSIREHSQISKGAGANVSELCFGSHTGTHIDPPKHFYDDLASIDQIPLERFCGPALVAEFPGKPSVTRQDLESLGLVPGINLLLKTDNSGTLSNPAFNEQYVYLTGDAAQFCKEIGVNMVGVDYLSVEQFRGDGTCPAHRTLLAAGILILEGLDLSSVSAGQYTLCAFPLNIPGGNGSPVRAVLLKED